MQIPDNIIATADDLGLQLSINYAILRCFMKGYINSTSFLTNTIYFEETVNLIHENPSIKNIGVHVNLAEGKPLTNFNQYTYLNEQGNWNIEKTNKKAGFLNTDTKAAFAKEIYAQIDRALACNVSIVHLDSHYHLHTLPCFYKLFLQASKHYKLKLRLAQTYNENNYLKFIYRKYINQLFKGNHVHYSDYFETVPHFLNNGTGFTHDDVIELMLHPDFDSSGKLTDHFDKTALTDWIMFLEKNRK